MTPEAYCTQVCERSRSNFYWGLQLTPNAQRPAITALYAFCREVDDVVDQAHDPAVAALKLAWWRQDIAAIADGRAQHLVTRALQAVSDEAPSSCHAPTQSAKFRLPVELLDEIILGMLMDLEQSRYPDYKTLRLYCHRVAGVVGQLAAEIFGARERSTLAYAENLGLALQLTNIIRDVGEDAARGRIYLPQDELARFGVDEQQILARQSTPAFIDLMQFQADRAEACFGQAFAQLAKTDAKAQRPGLVMASVYRALLRRIVRAGFPVLTTRVSLSPLAKVAAIGPVLLGRLPR